MRRQTQLMAVATSVLMALAGPTFGQTPATLTDFGPAAPTPGADDVSQLGVESGAAPTGLNYYFDNGNPPGQIFTTGSNANGYTLNSVSILTDGNSGGLPALGQVYELRLYSVSGSTATLMATFASQAGFTFFDYNWLQWTDLGTSPTVLAPNTQYAYTLRRTSAGWERLASTSGDLYVGGQAVLIPTAGGTIVTSSAVGFDATFVVGLTPITTLTVGAVSMTPSSRVPVGVPVTMSTTVAGGSSYSYQWLTDGGSGGTLTNVPSGTTATLAVDTAGLSLGVAYHYAVKVTSGSLSATSVTGDLMVYMTNSATITDKGTEITPGPNDISQLIGGGDAKPDGLNYYNDNNPPPGQTFTTGSNAQGYYLTSLSLWATGGGSGGTATLQGYALRLYSVSGDTAVLMVTLTNASFAFTYGDWLQWGGFTPITLKPNTTYAYTFQRSTTGWAGMSSTGTDPYSGGQVCLIPREGGTITYGASGLADAAFVVGLQPVGVGPSPYPFADTIQVSPSRVVVAGTTVTLTEPATGAAPLHYRWRTDGGTGGSLTNIPASDATNLVVNTTGWKPGPYKYDVVVTNVYGAATSAVATITVTYADTTATLADIGATDPVLSFEGDISQLLSAAGTADGLNYYYDNGNPPGQTFTTGSNPNGYTLTSLAIRLAGNAGGIPSAGQAYILRIYSVAGSTATLYATYTSQAGFTYTTSDWLRWSGFELPLSPNATYAYTFARVASGGGWERLDNTSGNPYAGGQLALVPTGGGTITFGSSADYDGTFIVGLALAGYPNVPPPSFSPASPYAGSPVTASATVTGTPPFTYQWQTDGGTGNFTDIAGARGATLTIDTTGMDSQTVSYRLIATNSAGVTIGEPSPLTVNPGSAPTLTADITSTPGAAFPGTPKVTLSVTFVGTLPISYQWRLDKGSGPVNLPGKTNATLVISNVTTADIGAYSVHVGNTLGTADSGTVSIYPQPAGPVTVNFQWHSTEGGDVGNYTGAGVAGFGTGTFWNQVIGPTNWNPGTFSSANALADNGTTMIGTKWTLVTGGSWAWTSTPIVPLLDSAASAYAAQNFTFDLPNGLYNVVLFSCNGTEAPTANGGTVFALNGVTQTALPTQRTNFIQGDTYVVFSNVVVTDTTLTGTWSPVVGKSYGSINGAQLQYLGPAAKLDIQRLANGQVQLSWTEGKLLEATSLTGSWTTNSATSPYTLSPSELQKFYRLIVK